MSTWRRKIRAMQMAALTQKAWRPGMMVKAPRPKAMTSVMEVTVTEMPACRIVCPIWRCRDVKSGRNLSVTCPLWQWKALVLFQEVVPALHDDKPWVERVQRVIFCFLHVVNPDPDGDEGEDVVGLVVLHPKHEHDAKSGAKSENAREHSGSKEVETNLWKNKKRGILVCFLPLSCSAYPTSSLWMWTFSHNRQAFSRHQRRWSGSWRRWSSWRWRRWWWGRLCHFLGHSSLSGAAQSWGCSHPPPKNKNTK